MIGAIVGDVIGSVYEGAGIKRKDFPLYDLQQRPTDDSVLTIAVAEAILGADGHPDEEAYRRALRETGRTYPYAGYGGSFRRWVRDRNAGAYHSWGNGAAMRSGAVGWAFDSEEEVLRQAELTALPTHNHPEGIKGAQALALSVYFARTGHDRDAIRTRIASRFAYDLDRSVDAIRPTYHFEISCQRSVPEAIIAFLDSASFEDAIRNAISLGGDADTQACIAGAIAEAFYGGVPQSLLAWVLDRLDGPQLRSVHAFAARYMPERDLAAAVDRYVGHRLASQERWQPKPATPAYRILLHGGTRARLAAYARRIVAGSVRPGEELARQIDVVTTAFDVRFGTPDAGREVTAMREVTADLLLDALLNTKRPRIFAESEVVGDGSDWSAEELSLLGDISVAVPVTIYDDGTHVHPRTHDAPFAATLIFVPGALLRSDRGGSPADWHVVSDGAIDRERYEALYERRLFPAFRYASASALAAGTKALITIPGLGCGRFAGPFHGTLGAILRDAIASILERHADDLPGIRAVWFDPYNECVGDYREIGHISLFVRPLVAGSDGIPQLSHPSRFAEATSRSGFAGAQDIAACRLFSVVAWDHVSWPGNDFYDGVRSTDDGVKAAATDSMYAMTGFRGSYDRARNLYAPPGDSGTWKGVVTANALRISAGNGPIVVGVPDESAEDAHAPA